MREHKGFTPGPWVVDTSNETGRLDWKDGGPKHRIVRAPITTEGGGTHLTPWVCGVSGWSTNCEANAALIANAPALLAEVRDQAFRLDQQKAQIDRLNAENDQLRAQRDELLAALNAAIGDVTLSAEIAHVQGNKGVKAELDSHLRIYRNAIANATKDEVSK